MKLHEQTQRFILLLIFYLFGPVLTLGVIGGVVLRKLPYNARSWERTLIQQTGLYWGIQSVEYCSPGFVRLHDVKIFDDTAQHTVCHIPQIDIRLVTDTSRAKIFPGILAASGMKKTGLTALLESSFPTFRSADRFWQITARLSVLDLGMYSSEESALLVQNMLRKVFARLETLSDVPVQFVFEQIYVNSEHSQQRAANKNEDNVDTFRFVQGNMYRTASEIRSDWSFQIRDVSEMDTQHLSFVLSLNDTMEITFKTGTQPIPCDLAAVFCSSFKHFTGGAFRGEFSLATRSVNNARTIRLNNVIFSNVPLAPLVGPYTDFTVMGTIADLQFEQAVLGTEGTFAKGCLKVQNGAIEKVLFHRCVDNFQLTVKPESMLDLPQRMIPFTACIIHFRLQPEGVDFWADTLWLNDAFMYQKIDVNKPEEWVAFLPPHRRTVTYHELMSIFAPDGAPVVPLTSGTQSLLQCIPIH